MEEGIILTQKKSPASSKKKLMKKTLLGRNSINRMFLHLTRLVYNQQNIICLHCTVGQRIKKSPGQKNLWNQINQLHE